MTDSSAGRTWTVLELIRWSAEDFEKRGIDTARLDAELLLAHALSCTRVQLYLRFEEVPPEPLMSAFREAVKRRRAREPVAHIVGKKSFHDIDLTLRPGLFVPRPETELLVDEAAARLLAGGAAGPRLLELGTGAGAITLSLLKAVPSLRAIATDVNPLAGENIRENAERLGLADRLEFRRGNLFEPVASELPFDLIAMNPPYVPAPEIEGLQPEVRDHEPREALDGGPDGLDLVRRLLAEAPSHLKPGGHLILELGEGQPPTVAGLAAPAFHHELTRKDLRGIPRIVVLRKK